jgi:molybdate transport system ATP-binding protein
VAIRVRDQRLFTGDCWTIGKGQHWAVVGPNGAGKTSLVGAIAGLVPVVAGHVLYHDPKISPPNIGYLSFETQRRLIAIEERRDESRSFSGTFNGRLTVRDFLRPQVADKTSRPDNRLNLIDHLGISELEGRPIQKLSTGEVRRVLIARELLKAPALLILDEPFDGLDSDRRKQMTSILNRLMGGTTQIILVTHRLTEIPKRITHIVGVKNHRLVFQKERNRFDRDRVNRLYDVGMLPRQEILWPDPPQINDEHRKLFSKVIVDMQNVTVRYGNVTIINHLNWTVRLGENWAIVGPNGSGKTTLLSLIAADNPQAYANDIRLFGRKRGSGETLWDIKRHIGLVSSEFQIRYRKQLSAEDAVVSGFFDSVGLYQRASSIQRQTAMKWMKRLGCEDLAKRQYHLLSQGEQRLVLLARAMVKSPRLLILDEPCQGLDQVVRDRLLKIFDQLGFESGVQLIYVTHQAEDRLACITHILRLERLSSGYYQATTERVSS